jgi:flavin reductase (DIM6/NTAB) family NADH-FMN oxidoreductase RutF
MPGSDRGASRRESFDGSAFRTALGHFATGVALATASAQGHLLGMTISSFNSVSLSPPLILFSISRSATSLPLWRAAENYGITVLSEHQTELSDRFARASADKFKDLRVESMENGAPLPSDWLAYFACEPYARYDGGDHDIFVGRVLTFRHRPQAAESRPLVFYKGKYRSLQTAVNSNIKSDWQLWSYGL